MSADAARDLDRGSSWVNGGSHRSQKGEKQGRRRRRRRSGAATRSRERGLGPSLLRSPRGSPACKRWGAVCCLQPRSLGNVPVFQQPWKQTPTVLETVTGAPATWFRFHPHDTDRMKHSQLFSSVQTTRQHASVAGPTVWNSLLQSVSDSPLCIHRSVSGAVLPRFPVLNPQEIS